jgi:hypothetical protein
MNRPFSFDENYSAVTLFFIYEEDREPRVEVYSSQLR